MTSPCCAPSRGCSGANTLQEAGQYKRARELAEDTLTRLRQILGADHPDTLRSARTLAAVLANLDECDQAHRRED